MQFQRLPGQRDPQFRYLAVVEQGEFRWDLRSVIIKNLLLFGIWSGLEFVIPVGGLGIAYRQGQQN